MPIKSNNQVKDQSYVDGLIALNEELSKMYSDIGKDVDKEIDVFFANSDYARTSLMVSCVRSILQYQISVLYNKRNNYFRPYYDAMSLPVPYALESISKYLYFLRKKVLETNTPMVYLGEKHRDYIMDNYQ